MDTRTAGGRGHVWMVLVGMVCAGAASTGGGCSAGTALSGDAGVSDATFMGAADGNTPLSEAGARDGEPTGAIEAGNESGAGGPSDAAMDVRDGSQEAACVPTSYQLAFVPPGGGSECSFTLTKPYTAGQINLLLTPGWGTVCSAGGSSGCGSGASADGWWFSAPNEISLCDATCTRFYDQPAGKLTVQQGCPSKACTH